MVETYLDDNVVFKENCFVQNIHEYDKQIHNFGVNVNNKNGLLERPICTVSEMSCSMMLHSSIFWKTLLLQTCGQWLLVMPHMFTIAGPIMRKS